jgi:Zn-dependent peptidase ImmA (M78 family)
MKSSPSLQEQIGKLLRECNISEPPTPVEVVAERLNACIRRAPFPDDLSGLLYREKDQEQPIIGVNSLHPEVRQRFTIAHEIGHLQLHPATAIHIDRSVLFRIKNKKTREVSDPEEREANQFAAELLMPERFIRKDLGNMAIEIGDADLLSNLAARYQVSQEAMVYRLMNLGYLASF